MATDLAAAAVIYSQLLGLCRQSIACIDPRLGTTLSNRANFFTPSRENSNGRFFHKRRFCLAMKRALLVTNGATSTNKTAALWSEANPLVHVGKHRYIPKN
ncbi:hypothetical protein TNCV_4767831 [Trichonephila clavipes]|nr:hypothetical protein TNCV_4767831 [Trichonephila clavipes]